MVEGPRGGDFDAVGYCGFRRVVYIERSCEGLYMGYSKLAILPRSLRIVQSRSEPN